MEFINEIIPGQNNDDYIILKTLGEGAYGIVFDAVHRYLNIRVAIKMIKRENLSKFKKELFSLKTLKHPNIISLIDLFSSGSSYYIVMDLAAGCDLHTYMTSRNIKLGENTCRIIGRQLASALCYMHGERIAHRDIKPDNIMVFSVNMKVKIVDFGLSGHVEDGKPLTSYCGTQAYIAPEIFRNEPYGVRVDMWSLGITLYEILTGVVPQFMLKYNRKSNEDIEEIVKIHLLSEDIRNCSVHLQNMMLSLLQPDPAKRIDSLRLCQHPWLTESFKKPIATYGFETLHPMKEYQIYRKLALITDKTISQTENIVKTHTFGIVPAMYRVLTRLELEKLYIQKRDKEPGEKRSVDDCSDYSKKRLRMKSVEPEMLC